jgi:hypothetical protein
MVLASAVRTHLAGSDGDFRFKVKLEKKESFSQISWKVTVQIRITLYRDQRGDTFEKDLLSSFG